MKTLLKQIFSILKDIHDYQLTNNQLLGFLIEQHKPQTHIKESDKKIIVTSEQIDYMLENDIPLNQWGDS